jgi:hypothetical protein
MKLVAGVTVFQDLVGTRMSINYSEVDDQGTVIADNKRIDRIITDADLKASAAALMQGAQNILNTME